MSDSLPVAAFKAYTKSLPAFYESATKTWDDLTRPEKEAWCDVADAILDAITPRTC